jgi:hypothetical protein
MPARSRLLATLLLLIGGLAWLSHARPGWLPDWGPGWRAVTDARHSLDAQAQRSDELAQRQDVTRRRIEAKQKVIRQLVEGRLALLEAAAWFRYLNENPSDCQDGYRTAWPGHSDEEKLCRQVIGWVEVEVRERSSLSQAEEMTRRLEAELDGHLARDGAVKLPALGGAAEARE